MKDSDLDFILDRYQNTKGLIFDVRENGGGDISEVFKLVSCFIDTTTLVYHSRLRNGTGHDEFTNPEPVYVYPRSGTKYLKPVAVLTDRGTYSAGSFFSLSTKAVDNLIMIGDTTGGGLGLPNGGQLPNGWTYRFSISQALTLDFNPAYENGVPPDISVSFDWNDLTKDEILERAILELN